jgi:hypothetical protein
LACVSARVCAWVCLNVSPAFPGFFLYSVAHVRHPLAARVIADSGHSPVNSLLCVRTSVCSHRRGHCHYIRYRRLQQPENTDCLVHTQISARYLTRQMYIVLACAGVL